MKPVTEKQGSQLLPFESPLAGKSVLLTGHTGFTGSWASLWLHSIGAKVYGYALPPVTNPSMYTELELANDVESEYGDICDYPQLKSSFDRVQPEVVLHLAAQPLVRYSYENPVSTFTINAIGTAHVLEAARLTPSVKCLLCVTTDKVYKNNEWDWPYRENDPLGGKDPYSASKAACEMIIDSYRASYGKNDGSGLAIATARGGNIIGGGDWSDDRLIPDFVRAVTTNDKLTLRYPNAIRPWQHVLALVQGYLMLLSGLISEPRKCARAWNFGPQDTINLSVRDVLEILAEKWARPNLEYMDNPKAEASFLSLDSSLARNQLQWVPVWDCQQMIAETAAWYRTYYQEPSQARHYSLQQLGKWRKKLFVQAEKMF